jgi:hypothetical protein
MVAEMITPARTKVGYLIASYAPDLCEDINDNVASHGEEYDLVDLEIMHVDGFWHAWLIYEPSEEPEGLDGEDVLDS